MNKQTDPYYPLKSTSDAVFNDFEGREIDLNNPKPENFQILGISTALSHICRFGGQVSRFYSVAQHSLLVAAMAPPEIKREALLHDATEAYLGDVIKPLKMLIEQNYGPIEKRFQLVINQVFGLDSAKLLKVKYYDDLALELEHSYLRCNRADRMAQAMAGLGLFMPEGPDLCYPSWMANLLFKEEFKRLFPEHK